jgi:GT2 family glycosyltransferase
MADTFFVTAVLVTHDGATWLPEVIAAVSSQTRPVDRIVAVDTGSLDNSLELLKASGVTTYPEDREMGYGDAIEHALALTKSAGENEWIWLIHDDCAPDQNALKLLLDAIEERPQVAIAGPKLRDWFDRDRLLEVGVSIAGNGSRWTGLEVGEQDQGQHDSITDVMSVSTAAMLVRRSIFEELGGLDINLALFRDDVDLGWRAHVAGYKVICVESAIAFHVEASANERRAVDVSEAFLHRPLLLDRRNAAYVLLVNSSWWILPWIALQLFSTSIARALINLLAKLPGYAGDEIAAVGLLLAHPAELFQARRNRKKKRLLSPRVVSHYIPSTWSQLQLALSRASSAISRAVLPNEVIPDRTEPSYSDIGTVSPDFDDSDLTPPPTTTFWKYLFKKPQFIIAAAIALVSIIASRGRFGSLSGGALALAPHSGLDLLHRYAEGWHAASLGSAASMPPWIALLGISSLITFGNAPLLVTLIFLFAPAISYLALYRVLLRQAIRRNYGLIGAGIYAASPVLWASMNQGRLGTLLVIQLLPTLLALEPFSRSRERSTWRRIFAISLLAGVIGAFSPLLLGLWLLGNLLLLGQALFDQRHHFRDLGWRQFIESDRLDGAKRRFTLLATPFLLTFPWSLSLVIHPTQLLLEPGIPTPAGSRIDIALFNPGGISAPPLWIMAPFIALLVLALVVRELRSIGATAAIAIGGALAMSQLVITGHGSRSQVWVGPLIAVAMVVLLAPTFKYVQEFLPALRERHVGFSHFGLAFISVVAIFNVVATPLWAVAGGSHSLVVANKSSRIPAFISALQETPARPKTLVIASTGEQTTYFISRGSDLYLGDADTSVAIPDSISQTMNQLIGGSGITSARTLGGYGIAYLYLENPAPAAIVRVIDGVGGFSRMSSTSAGIVWKVIGSSPRVQFIDSQGVHTAIASENISAVGHVTGPGTLVLAEKYDVSWRLTLDGKPIRVERSSNGLPIFAVPQGGEISLSYDGAIHGIFLAFEIATLIVAIVMSLPAGRRRRDRSTEVQP